MRHKRKNRLKELVFIITNFVVCRAIISANNKVNAQYKNFKKTLSELPVVVALSEKLRLFILGFFDFVAPVWKFFFLKTPKPNMKSIDTSLVTLIIR